MTILHTVTVHIRHVEQPDLQSKLPTAVTRLSQVYSIVFVPAYEVIQVQPDHHDCTKQIWESNLILTTHRRRVKVGTRVQYIAQFGQGWGKYLGGPLEIFIYLFTLLQLHTQSLCAGTWGVTGFTSPCRYELEYVLL